MLTEVGLLDTDSAANLEPRGADDLLPFLSYHNLVILPSLNRSDLAAVH